MNPNPYTATQGLPTGVTATFAGFNHFDQDPDHTNNGDDKLVYGTSNSPVTITFGAPVTVPSFWVTTGPFGKSGAVITGSLAGQSQFLFTNSGPKNTFLQVTAGAGKSIDLLTFSNYLDNELDDVTITPEPSAVAAVVPALLLASRRRRRVAAAQAGRSGRVLGSGAN